MSTLRLLDDLAPEVRDKYAEAYARKLSPRYRMPRNSGRGIHITPLSVIPARGLRVDVSTKKTWPFEGWQHDQAKAEAMARHIETKGYVYAVDARRALAHLVRLTPRHNTINAAYPVEETHDTETKTPHA